MKKVLAAALSLLFLFHTLACQPTPQKDAVVNKGEGKMQEKIDAAPLKTGPYEAPATVKIDVFGSETFEVEVDAEVVVPHVTKYPVAEIEKRFFTPEWIRKMMLTMADGKPIYSYETEIPQTKETILKEITTLQEMLTNPEAQFTEGMSEDEKKALIEDWKESLEAWQEYYKTAPDTFEGEELDLSDETIAQTFQIAGAVDFGKKRNTYLTIVHQLNDPGSNVSFNNLDDAVGLPFHYDLGSDFTNLNGVTISKEEAIQIGLDYIEKLGETGFSPSLVLVGYCQPRKTPDKPIEQWEQCYKIYYTRSVNEVPTTYRESTYDVFVNGGSVSSEDELYNAYYPQEYIEMVIRDSGVNYMFWQMPSTITKVVNESVELLPFDEIMERFKSQVLYNAIPGLDEDSAMIKKKLVITRIQLGMMQVRKKDSGSALLMIPTWTFFGKTIQTYDGPQPGGYDLNENNEYIEETPGYSYLVLNAIDGSVINPYLGY